MFKVENLSCIANNAKIGKAPAIWVYYNEDGDVVTGAGFIPAKYGMKAKDQVLVIQQDGQNNAWHNASVAITGVITLALNA